jgi:hypothetical protein
MPKLTGSFSGKANWQTTIPQNDTPNHEVSFLEIDGSQESADPLWNNARIKYWGICDLIEGNGNQSGYFVNEHTDGTYDRGTFEARVSTTGKQTTMEGTWRITGGTGKLNGIAGNGSFRSRMLSATEVETTWEGAYEVVEAKRGAGR